MPASNPLASQITITLEGQPLSEEVLGRLRAVSVDQHAHLPDTFLIRLMDTDLKMLDEGPFDLGKRLKIEAENAEGEKSTLLEGEVTALEPDFQEGMLAELVVRGYDFSHRLYRQPRTATYLNVKDSDLAEQIARQANLQAQTEPTTAVYEHVFQHNQSDLRFLRERARRIGYECFVQGNTLYFRKPPASGQPAVTLTWGQDLHTFAPRMSVAEQVEEVVVRGWDPARQQSIVGRAQQGGLYPAIGESKDGAAWAGSLGGGKKVVVRQPVSNQEEANTLAEALLNEISGAFIQAEGRAFRRPDIRAGEKVQIEGVGQRLSGAYLVTQARHTFTPSGLQTTFRAQGVRSGLLQDALRPKSAAPPWGGVVTAVVTNADDPDKVGRVKIKFPWLSDDAESFWVRLAAPGAGREAGLCLIPAVGDEVVVAFEQGDFNRPVVLGGLWSSAQKPPPATTQADGEMPKAQSWRSRSGHAIVMMDNAENKVSVKTAGGHALTLDDANKKIEVVSSGGLKVVLDDNTSKITLESGGDVEVTARGNLKVQANAGISLEAAANLDLKANGVVTVKGSLIKLN